MKAKRAEELTESMLALARDASSSSPFWEDEEEEEGEEAASSSDLSTLLSGPRSSSTTSVPCSWLFCCFSSSLAVSPFVCRQGPSFQASWLVWT